MMFRKASDVLGGIADMFRSPDRITPAEAANKHFKLPEGGSFDVMMTPYMKEPMNLAASRKHLSVVFAGPARTGKTLALLDGVLAWLLTSNASDTLVVHMTEASARKYSKMRIARLIRNSPKIKKLLTSNRDDDNVLTKFFRNGMALVIASPAPTNLSASDYKFVMLSDYDRMSNDNGEGNIYIQAAKRTQTFMSAGMCLVESSPGRDFMDNEWKPTGLHEAPPVEGILGLYNDGDRRMWYWKCPHCDEFFCIRPGLDLFSLPSSTILLDEVAKASTGTVARRYAKIYCTECGCSIDERMKTKLNNGGVWIKENPDSENTTASFWLGGVAAKFQSWQQILDKYLKALVDYHATGEEKKIKATLNVDLAMPFTPFAVSNKLTAAELELRAEDFPKKTVPANGCAIFASVDVQIRHFAVYVECVLSDGSKLCLDRFDIRRANRTFNDERAILDPAGHFEDWDTILDEVIKMRYPIEGNIDGTEYDMGVCMTTCDSGGKAGVTENAYKFDKKVKSLGLGSKFKLIKGETPKPRSNKPTIFESTMDESSSAARKAKTVGTQKVWILNTTLLKDAVSANLKRMEDGENKIYFPEWLPSSFYKELTVEIRTENGWENLVRHPNESFDLMCYAKAGFMIKKSKHGNRDIQWGCKLPYWLGDHTVNPEIAVVGKFEYKKPVSRRYKRSVRAKRN